MACFHPRIFKTVDAFGRPKVQSFSCGKCLGCVKDRQNSWKIRLIEEAKDWNHVFFFTLTYRDSALPLNVLRSSGLALSSARKSDVQGWLKRFRQNFLRMKMRQMNIPFKYASFPSVRDTCSFCGKYFICAEYGPNGTHRPHYHGVLFTNHSYYEVFSLFSSWVSGFGHVKWSELPRKREHTSSVMNYVGKYCCKGEFSSRSCHIDFGLIEPAWSIMSKGLGASYLDRCDKLPDDPYLAKLQFHTKDLDVLSKYIINLDKYKLNDVVRKTLDLRYYTDGSYKYKLPRYYVDRLYKGLETYDVLVWNRTRKCMESKQVKRYASTSVLSVAMQNQIRERILDEYSRLFVSMRCLPSFASLSDFEIHCKILRQKRDDLKLSEDSLRKNLSGFYVSNKIKNRNL